MRHGRTAVHGHPCPPVPLLYVFGDLAVLTPAEVAYYTCHRRRAHTGAYYLVNTGRAHRFDDIFGPAAMVHDSQRATPSAHGEGSPRWVGAVASP